jgi:hypothetical protein
VTKLYDALGLLRSLRYDVECYNNVRPWTKNKKMRALSLDPTSGLFWRAIGR